MMCTSRLVELHKLTVDGASLGVVRLLILNRVKRDGSILDKREKLFFVGIQICGYNAVTFRAARDQLFDQRRTHLRDGLRSRDEVNCQSTNNKSENKGLICS
jgi:hypothetical protein